MVYPAIGFVFVLVGLAAAFMAGLLAGRASAKEEPDVPVYRTVFAFALIALLAAFIGSMLLLRPLGHVRPAVEPSGTRPAATLVAAAIVSGGGGQVLERPARTPFRRQTARLLHFSGGMLL